MTLKSAKLWGLVVPGRPPTPSEGHAQIYARIGPVATQRLIAFDNGTCLSFGPDDLVDEFGPQDAFAEQVALVDKAVHDCQSVTQRYPPKGDDDNRFYDGFRTKPLDFSKLIRVPQTWAIHHRIPSKLASVGTIIPVYAAQTRKHEWPGYAHPGASVDTRFGMTGHPGPNAIQDQIRRETDRERDLGIRERDEQERIGNQRGHHHFRLNRPTRRGRRSGRGDGPGEEQQQRVAFLTRGGPRMQGSNPQAHSNTTAISQNQRSLQASTYQNFHKQASAHPNSSIQAGSRKHALVRARDHMFDQSYVQQDQLQDLRETQIFSNSPYSVEFNMFPRLPPLGNIEYNDVPPQWHFKHAEWQILANAREAGLEGQFLNHIPERYRSISYDSTLRPEIISDYYQQGLDRFYESEDDFLEPYFAVQRDRYNVEHARFVEENMRVRAALRNHGQVEGAKQRQISYAGDGVDGEVRDQASYNRGRLEGGMPYSHGHLEGVNQDRLDSYAQPHQQTARQADRKLARYANQLNQLTPHPDTGRLRDALVGGSAQPAQITSRNESALGAMAEQQAMFDLAQNQQSIGSSPRPSGVSLDFSDHGFSHPSLQESADSREAYGVGDDSIAQCGGGGPVRTSSARARAADERRAGSGCQYITQSRSVAQMDTAVLAPSGVGIYSREPSPMPPRNGRFFDQSRRSSPGAARCGRGQGYFDRSTSARNF